MKYTHLTEEERYHIDDLQREGFNQATIAKQLGRSPSTLSRELCRNKGERGWRPRQAQLKAVERLVYRGRHNAKKTSIAAWDYAEKHLKNEQWSPEQISGRLALDGLESISHETCKQKGSAMMTLLELYCHVDEFVKIFMPVWQKQLIAHGKMKRNRASRLSISEIMTIIIHFHQSKYRDFKSYYLLHVC